MRAHKEDRENQGSERGEIVGCASEEMKAVAMWLVGRVSDRSREAKTQITERSEDAEVGFD